MPWYFRRSRKFGPFRFTVSKSGISGSVGFGGLRVTNSKRGTYLSASPGGGLFYRERIGSPSIPTDHTIRNPDPVLQEITSDPVSKMVDCATVVERIDENERRGVWIPWLGAAITIPALALIPWPYGFLLAVGALAGCLALRSYLPSRTPVELEYQLDEDDRERFELLSRAIDSLAQCNFFWCVDAFGSTSDWKRNGGATKIIRRSAASAAYGIPRSLRVNLNIPHILAGKDALYFLPDFILVRQNRQFGSLAYSNLSIESSVRRFNEEQTAPTDGEIVGTTWRYVNKNGGPDRRFNNNRQIPVLNYGEVVMRSQSGLRMAFMTSRAGAAAEMVNGIRKLQSSKATQMMYRQVSAPNASDASEIN